MCESPPSTTMVVCKWDGLLRSDRTTLGEDPREAAQKLHQPEISAKILDVVLRDRRLTEKDLI